MRIRLRPSRLAGLGAAITASVVILAGCSDSGDTSDAGNGESFTVTHAMGETQLAGVPERVVVIDSPHLDALVALGITPVGATESGAGTGFPGYVADQLTDTEVVGLTSEPDIDAIANLQPDLIIGAKVRHEAIYDELSSIAPTVFSVDSGTNWQEQALITAAAVNQTDQMQTLLDELSTRAGEVGEAIGADGKTLSIVRFRPDNFRLYGPDTFSGSVLSQVGFNLGDREWNEYSMAELSPELYEQINGEIIFFTNPGGDPNATTMKTVTGLWGTLPAVQDNQAFEVEDETWMVGIGVIGANLILDQTEEALS